MQLIALALAAALVATACHTDGERVAPVARTPAVVEASARAALGAAVPDFRAVDSRGEPFRLSEREGITVLTFWCTTCDSCRGVERELDALAEGYAPRGVAFAAIDSNHPDDAARVNAFLAAQGLGLRVLLDPTAALAELFGARLTTTTAVVDADGRLAYWGAFHGARFAVDELLAGEPVSEPDVAGYG